jgi:N-acetylglucosamine repressor
MGVRTGAISRLIDDLIQTKQVFEAANTQQAFAAPDEETRRGRRPRYLYIETRRRCAIAVDITLSGILMQVTDTLGHPLLELQEFPIPSRPQDLVGELAKRIKRVLADQPEVGNCLGVGIVIAGLVDPDRGRLRYAPTLGFRDIDIREPLEAAIKLPVVVENSMKACVLAQVWAVRGHAPVDGPVAFVGASDGVGVGIAIDGQLLRGAHNNAGEFGHVALSIDGPRCACGQRGCWEAYVSVGATVARYLGSDRSGQASARGKVTVATIVARARGGDARAFEALRETGYYLGRGLAIIVKAIEPRRIYMSGEITEGWDLILPTVQQAMREQALIREAADSEILTVSLGEHPRLRGATALVTSPAFAAPVVA